MTAQLNTYVVTYREWQPQERLVHAFGPWDAARKATQTYGAEPDEVTRWINPHERTEEKEAA